MTEHPLRPLDDAPEAVPRRGTAFMSIGTALRTLREQFPEVTISKIRFLEGEGLVQPLRTPSGYRKFSREDVARLAYVLRAQRDNYLPLRVIKENLEALDRGLEPPNSGGEVPTVPVAPDGVASPAEFVVEPPPLRLSRAELVAAAGLPDGLLASMEQYGLLAPKAGGYYDADALVVARTVAAMAKFGIEPRHLRPFKSAAEREVGLMEQVLSPLVGQRDPETRARAEATAKELAALSVALHTALVRTGLGPALAR